ncbi:hypothetical protein [Microvirga sp. G4-2]|uniref:hypothetical protein n=1 Tax=Microvirga sp. G4-2 TaxID=3434467 RepID=UPI004043CFB3
MSGAPVSSQPNPPEDDSEVETPSEPSDHQEPQAPPAPPVAPASMPPLRAASYMLASVLLALTQGLGMNLISANLPQIQGALGATTNEAIWLMTAYVASHTDSALMKIQGLTLLNRQATKEADILAYNDAFLAIALLAVFALAALIIHVAVVAVGKRLAPIPQPSAA